ncbi:MYXO-CTERM sorting domain-containing protein [candidate division KSB1 bacterium]
MVPLSIILPILLLELLAVLSRRRVV